MCLPIRSTAVKATAVNVEIVVMLRWSWVLLLLLLLTVKGFVASVTCVVKLGT